MLTRALPLTNDERMDESLVVAVDIWTTLVHLRRGQPLGDVEEILARAREVEELQVLAPALALAAEAALAAGDPARAAALAAEFETVTRGKAAMYRSESAVAVARLALAAGAPEVADDLVARSEPVTMRDELFVDTAAAVVREAEGAVEPEVWADLERRWHDYGNVYEEAHAALALGRAAGDAEATARGRGDARRARGRRVTPGILPPRGSRRRGTARDRGADRRLRRQRGQGLQDPGGRHRPEHRRARSCSWSARSPRTS